MTDAEIQARIDRIQWYHEFDFGRGLKTRATTPDVEMHRGLWKFIEANLDAVDFRGKSVLEVGCWDGYWSFAAERRGARSVLASDDRTQNWASGEGLLLARELLGSSVQINQDLSIYRLDALGRTFDIVICFGVYYHLFDPFLAFAQLRHCSHAGTVVLIEGDVGVSLGRQEARFDFGDGSTSAFVPSHPLLRTMLEGAYFTVERQAGWKFPDAVKSAVPFPSLRLNAFRLFKQCLRDTFGLRRSKPEQAEPETDRLPTYLDRVFTVCKPFDGTNKRHHLRPPFGLDRYDPRFRA